VHVFIVNPEPLLPIRDRLLASDADPVHGPLYRRSTHPRSLRSAFVFDRLPCQLRQAATDDTVDAARQTAANRTTGIIRDHNRQVFESLA
jgi:hypothetical protein